MNPIFQNTKTEILERKCFSKTVFPDDVILKAIESYEFAGPIKQKAQEFLKSLSPLWRDYKKEAFVPILNEFIEMELSLEAMSPNHTSHINHIIQEFLFGYNIIMNCDYIKKEYDLKNGRGDSRSTFGELFFSWMAASLLHDIGYDIENAPEEEEFREKRNKFWNFMTNRVTSSNCLSFKAGGEIQELIENFVLSGIKDIPSGPNLNYSDFERIFARKVEGKRDWYRYDHGVISALKYLTELKKLQEENKHIEYLNWEPNRNAILAMALHNFRYQEIDLNLSIKNKKTTIAYLLIICDEIQYWERERLDMDAELLKGFSLEKAIKKKTELEGITFKNDHAYVILNHKLIDNRYEKDFIKNLDDRILKLKIDYPISILYPLMDVRNDQSIFIHSLDGSHRAEVLEPELTPRISVAVPQKYIDLNEESIKSLKCYVTEEKLESLITLALTQTEKKLLIPSNPPVYKIYIEHRIEGKPYLTVVFPL